MHGSLTNINCVGRLLNNINNEIISQDGKRVTEEINNVKELEKKNLKPVDAVDTHGWKEAFNLVTSFFASFFSVMILRSFHRLHGGV